MSKIGSVVLMKSSDILKLLIGFFALLPSIQSLSLPLMLTSFPTPVLSIAADAVRDLEGRDALSGLWTRTFPSSFFSPNHIPKSSKCLRNVKNPCKTGGDWRTSLGDCGIAT